MTKSAWIALGIAILLIIATIAFIFLFYREVPTYTPSAPRDSLLLTPEEEQAKIDEVIKTIAPVVPTPTEEQNIIKALQAQPKVTPTAAEREALKKFLK